MNKKMAVWIVFRWEDFMSLLKEEEWSEGDLVFIVDTPVLSSQSVALIGNIKNVCRLKKITLIRDYDELQAEIYKRKVEYRKHVLSEVTSSDRQEDENPI